MKSKFKYPNKRETIRIFEEITQKDKTIKRYIHARDTTLRAYVRQLSANEQASADAMQDASDTLFAINHRPGVNYDMYIEWLRPGKPTKTFKIDGVDPFEYLATEMTLRATSVNPREYTEVRWKDELL